MHLRVAPQACVLAVTLLAGVAAEQPPTGLRGYSPDTARAEREWEGKFRAIPQTANLRDYMRRLSARPHQVGSPADRENAEWILSKFKEWGLDARIETFNVLFPTPRERAVELVEPQKFVAKLQEPALAADPISGHPADELPTYNAYSADGDVTAPLVYVNFGVPQDYEQLANLGVSVKGAIVIARYGGSWRGIKPKVAAEHGAVGCIIYSDPHEDGYFEGDVLPGGAWRPREGVQRGSVMDMPVYPGDPLTPGIGATAGATRLKLSEARTLARIPVLPISYADAQPLLGALGGRVAPNAWRGALPITYHIGPGPAKVHLKVAANWDVKPIYDVIATIPGSSAAGEWIVRGNHHDAWVYGAEDPISGLTAMMEEARGLAELRRQGWTPRRTIVYCAWDGEEPGLLGSTAWAEAHANELAQRAAVYINSDSNSRGYLSMSGSHTLERFINDIARDVPDPETKLTAWKRLQLSRIAAAPQDRKKETRERHDLRIGALGSGSDYTVFIDHLGVASLDVDFSGEDGGGIYHSIYDDFYWFTHFSDTDFVYGRALAQTAGTAVMRLAGAEVLPFEFGNFADVVRRYTGEVKKLLDDKRQETLERNSEIDEGVFGAIRDPKKPNIEPAREAAPPHLNFAPLENAADALARSADRYEKAFRQARLGAVALASLNTDLIQSERRLTDPAGLPRRPWFRHQIYAPGFYTGYGVKTLPGVREAIEQKNWKEAETEVARVAAVLAREAELIDRAASALEQAGQPIPANE